MNKSNNKLLVILFMAFIGLQTNLKAQVSSLGNGFPGGPADYVGWNATRFFPLTIAHKGNFPINFQTTGILRAKLNQNINYPVNTFAGARNGYLLLGPDCPM